MPVRGRRQRELLAVLLLRANRLVPLDLLIDMFWPDRPPASAERQVQNGVGRLRRTLAEGGVRSGVVETQPGGYMLQVSDDELDTLTFMRHVTAGRQAAANRPGEAVTWFCAALALWRGAPLADIDVDLVAREARLLGDQRLRVLEECAELKLGLGRYDEVADELTAVVHENPLRERLCALLMMALHRGGRSAEALAVFTHVRTHFVTELQLEPGAELRALGVAIQRDVQPAGPLPPRPRQLPADTFDFVGRAKVLVELENLFRRGQSGPAVAVAAISGPAGVGKTTLAIHVAHRLLDVFPDGQLYVNLMGDGQWVRIAPAEVLARFLRALGVAGQSIPDGVDERAEMYRSCLGDRRVLVVLDNAVDEAQVRQLLPGGAGCAVLLTRRAPMAGLPGARLFPLDVLEPGPATDLLAKIVGRHRISADMDATRELVRLCGRLPLALRIAGARLVTRPGMTPSDLTGRLADESARLTELTYGDLEIRASLALSYRDLRPAARKLLRVLSLLEAPDVDGWACAALLDLPITYTGELIKSLTDAQLLEPLHRNGTDRPRYRLHDLVRLYARERAAEAESPADSTAAIARMLSGLLALVRRAHIAVSGGDFVSVHGGSILWTAAVDELANTVDADPLAWYEVERLSIVAGVRQAAERGLDELCWELAVGTYTLFLTRGHYDDWTQTHAQALATTRKHGNRRGQGAVLLGFGSLQAYRRNYVQAAELLDESVAAFREIGDQRSLSYALGAAAHVEGMRGHYEQAIARHETSIAMHDEVGDPLAVILGLRALGKLLVDVGRLEQAGLVLARAVAMSGQHDRRAHAEVLYTIGQLQLARGETDRAEQTFHNVLAVSEEIGDPRGAASARYGLGLVRLATDALPEAKTLLSQALVQNQQLGAVLTEGRIRLSLGEMHRRCGQPDQARRHLGEAVRVFTASQTPLWLARALNATGDVHFRLHDHVAARVSWCRARDLFTEAGSAEADVVAAKLADLVPPADL